MSTTKKTIIGTADLIYIDDKLQIAYFTPSIGVTKEQLKDQLGDCTGKSIEDIRWRAQSLLAWFFNKERSMEFGCPNKVIETEIVKDNIRLDNARAIEIQFIYEQ